MRVCFNHFISITACIVCKLVYGAMVWQIWAKELGFFGDFCCVLFSMYVANVALMFPRDSVGVSV